MDASQINLYLQSHALYLALDRVEMDDNDHSQVGSKDSC